MKLKHNNINNLIDGLKSGKTVSRRRLRRIIGKSGIEKMDKKWLEEVQSRSYKPPEIVEYSRQLGIALRKYGKADYHSLKRSPKARGLFDSADTCFERAMEYLMDMVTRVRQLTT